MEAKHTPGPWDIDWYVCRDDGKELWRVPECIGPIWAHHTDRAGPHFDCSEADALLVSAAPDLLEALKGMVAMYCDLVESSDAGYWNPEDDPEVKAARAAIAKAEGKDSA